MKKRYSFRDGVMVEDENGEWVKYAPRKKAELPSIDKQVSTRLVVYFAQKFKVKKGFEPTVSWGAWKKIMQKFVDDADEETVRTVIDTFFAYPKRLRFGIYDFQRHYDDVYGFLHQQKYGNVNAQR